MIYKRGVTCQIAAFEIPNPPSQAEARGRKWLAIATSQVYDPKVEVPGLGPDQVALAGETMRVLSGRAFADTEADAMQAALEGLLFELTAKGFSTSDEVELT